MRRQVTNGGRLYMSTLDELHPYQIEYNMQMNQYEASLEKLRDQIFKDFLITGELKISNGILAKVQTQPIPEPEYVPFTIKIID